MRSVLLLAALLFVACGRVEIQTGGKPCPCADGNDCDEVCKICVPPGTIHGKVCAAQSACKIQFGDFHAEWATPNSVFWRWQPLDPNAELSFQSYRLELTAPGREPLFYDYTNNPELGRFTLPNDGKDLVTFTIADGLEPGVAYTGKLIAQDTGGCEFDSTNIAPVTPTPVSASPIEIFGPTPTSGFVAAQDGAIVSTGCHEGSQCLQTPVPTCVPDADAGKTECTYNLKLDGLDIGVGAMTTGQFQQAYLELYARTTSTAPSYYSWVWLDAGLAEETYWRLNGFTFPNGTGYKRFQVPLRVLLRDGDGEPLAFDTLEQDIHEFVFGTQISPDSSTWVDEVYIRW